MQHFRTITEGRTRFTVSTGKISKKLPVFYNPAKEFDRDLSVLLLKAMGKKTVLDLLAASGARGLRLMKEAKCKVHFNDINKKAVALIKKNLKLNKLKATVTNERADKLLTSLDKKFDFIDIDPFGSPITYVYQAVPKLEKDGILAVTATDLAALYGVYPKTCFRKYGSFPLHVNFGHELGIRILAKAVIEIAAKQNISLTPVFAHATMHYYRIYFQASRSFAERVLEKIGFVYYCKKCLHRFFTKFEHRESCPICKHKLDWAGPLYTGNLWSQELISRMMEADSPLTRKHIQFLQLLHDEAQVDIPYFFETLEFKGAEPRLSDVISKLQKAGFKASRTHFSGKGIRTDATFEELKQCF
jgi:tRNA (guanine26-N2/guanine27-N2)-dimethyltransferase